MASKLVTDSVVNDSAIKTHSKTVVLVIFDAYNQGPVVLYELLVEHGYPCKFVYYLHDDGANRRSLAAFIHDSNTMLIGFSFASHSTKVAFELSRYLSHECPDIPIIFGGVHPTIAPLSCVDYCNAVCVGEGEKALLEIVENLMSGRDYLTSRNLTYKRDGRIVRNAFHPLISDLDVLPIQRPYTADHVAVEDGEVVTVDKAKYFELMPRCRTTYIQAFSRGCPHSCSYCCNSKFHEIYPKWGKVRSKSVHAIIEEVCENIRFNPKIIKVFFTDDCFLAHSTDWLQDFAGQWRLKVNKEFNFFTIPEQVTRDKLEVLKTIDLSYCSIGLQSGSKRTNIFYNRRFSEDMFLQACRLIRSLNIGLVVNVLFDNPWEDDEDLLETLDVLTEIKKPFYIMHYSLRIYPGTKLSDHCRDNNVDIPDFNLRFENYLTIRVTDANRVMILAQLLPRKTVFYLFRNRHKRAVKVLIRFMYLVACAIMPFHALRVATSRSFVWYIRLAFDRRREAIRWVKALFGIHK